MAFVDASVRGRRVDRAPCEGPERWVLVSLCMMACPLQEGTCAFGDHCPYAHNVFEYWLHPTR